VQFLPLGKPAPECALLLRDSSQPDTLIVLSLEGLFRRQLRGTRAQFLTVFPI
jgi:hypothetical protein